MRVEERVVAYSQSFPDYAPLHVFNNRIEGIWVIGNTYGRDYNYYGAFPHGYLHRVLSLFPDKKNLMYAFSGPLKDIKGVKVDINPTNEPDICCDITKINDFVEPNSFDLIIADPPYSKDDAVKYNVKYVDKRKALKALVNTLIPSGHIVWLDQMVPIYSKEQVILEGLIALYCGTNRRIRITSIFVKPPISNNSYQTEIKSYD